MVTEKTPLLPNYIIKAPKISEDDDYLKKTKGLSLEELMPFQDDPWWSNLRRTSLLIFWFTLILMFAAACTLSMLQYGSCPVRHGLNSNGTLISAIIMGNHSLSGTGVGQTLGFQ